MTWISGRRTNAPSTTWTTTPPVDVRCRDIQITGRGRVFARAGDAEHIVPAGTLIVSAPAAALASMIACRSEPAAAIGRRRDVEHRGERCVIRASRTADHRVPCKSIHLLPKHRTMQRTSRQTAWIRPAGSPLRHPRLATPCCQCSGRKKGMERPGNPTMQHELAWLIAEKCG